MSDETTFTFSQTVEAPASAVYYALTHQTAVVEWLCDHAQLDARPTGRIYLHWQQGYYAAGAFTALETDQKVAFSWQGRGESAVSAVEFTLAAENGRTHVHLTHSGLGNDESWAQTRQELKTGWENSLANLKSVLETGIDRRAADRPFMGILIVGAVDEKEAAANNWPVKGGIRLNGTVAGTGAEAAGLQDGDVVIGIGGNETFDFNSLQAALTGYKVGDSVAVAFYRGEDKLNVAMTLSQRPIPRAPETPQAFADHLQQLYQELNTELDGLLAEATEEEANYRPALEAWNAKEILAHLIGSERAVQMIIATQITDGTPGDFPNNPPAWVKMITTVYPTLSAVVNAWKTAQAETIALVANLPDNYVARKTTYHNSGGGFLQWTPGHIREHYGEIRAVIEAARAQK